LFISFDRNAASCCSAATEKQSREQAFPATDRLNQLLGWDEKAMNVTLDIPDDVAQRLSASGGDLSRRALQALAAEEYRQGHLTKPDLRRLLGFQTSDEIDTFLKAHEVWIDYSLDDLERERGGLRRLGL